jgi:hypothetical protein
MGDIIAPTDLTIPCGTLGLSLVRMLAASMVKYNGITRLNLIPVNGDCETLTDFWTCVNNGNMNDETAEAALVANAFGVDSCGRLGLKVFADWGLFQ